MANNHMGNPAADLQTADQVPVDVFPASSVQQRLWLLEQLAPGAGLYNSPFVYRVIGALDEEALRRALESVTARHEVLRTTLVMGDRGLEQQIHPGLRPELRVELVGDEALALELAAHECRRPFNLETGPLIRAALFKIASARSVLAVTVHHTVFDGWSEAILLQELEQYYLATREGRSVDLPELPIQYADYAVWEQEQLAGAAFDRDVEYWKTALADLNPASIPTDFSRPPLPSGRGAWEMVRIEPDLTGRLKTRAAQERSTLFMLLMAGMQILLWRYSGYGDASVGFIASGRERSEISSLIGCFINTLVLRVQLDGELTCQDVVRAARQAALDAFRHQEVPFDRVVGHRDRESAASSLFQVLINQGPPIRGTLAFASVTLERVPLDLGVAKFDLSLEIGEVDGGLEGYFEYSTDLFTAETVRRIKRHYEAVLAALADSPTLPISRIPLLSAEERAHLIDGLAGPRREVALRPVVGEFEAIVAACPDATALVAGDQTLTYTALDARAAVFAALLMEEGVGPGDPIGVLLPRTADAIVALLAIFKAGAVYVPLDPGHPDEHLSFILSDAGIRCVITTSDFESRIGEAPIASVCIDRFHLTERAGTTAHPSVSVTLDMPAYVLYTSGSTGRPKGVVVSHRALAAHSTAVIRHYDLSPDDCVLQFAALTLDPSIEQILPTLAVGGRLVMRGDSLWGAGECFAQLALHGVTVADFPTAYWIEVVRASIDNPTLAAGTRLRLMLVGGEAMPVAAVREWARSPLSHIRLLNVYGPTEATVTATVHEVSPDIDDLSGLTAVPIGRPLENRRAYLVDTHGELVPFGAPGELCLAGEGLAVGYLNRPELTEEKWPPDPFVGGGARMYRTGDLARYRADGGLLFLGRIDDQVKIRGFRIELGEVESALQSIDGVAAAAVVARGGGESPSDRYLAAFVVPSASGTMTLSELRSALAQKLPEFMVPRTFTFLDKLPVARSGKIDRKALQALAPVEDQAADTNTSETGGLTGVEQRLAAIWCDLLNRPTVAADDDFFAIGGHSLLAIRLLTAVAEEFDVELPLELLFQASKLSELARRINEEAGIPQETPVDTRDLSDVERRLARIWCSLLDRPSVQVGDDFFAIGGHSLLAIRLVTEIAEEFDVELPLEVLFQAPTLAHLAMRIEQETGPSPVVQTRESAGRREPVGPRTETERRLSELCQSILGVEAIGIHDPLDALAHAKGTSIEGVLEVVREAFGVFAEGLPVDEFMRAPTIATLARTLDARLEPQSGLVVALHTEAVGRPLFLVHAGGGYVFFYRALAGRLGRPVYGIRAAADDEPEPFSSASTLEELAARYIREMKAVQRVGPYHLGGACFGGVVAFEMARQLVANGERTEGPVLLLDAFVQNNSAAPHDLSREAHSRTEYLQKRIRTHIERSRQLGFLGGVRYLSEKIRSNSADLLLAVPAGFGELSRRLSAAGATIEEKLRRARTRKTQSVAERVEECQLRTIAGFLEATDKLLLRYWPGRYDGPVAYLAAHGSGDPRSMWAGLMPDELFQSCMVEGDHMSMFDEPAVANTAAWIRHFLDGEDPPMSERVIS